MFRTVIYPSSGACDCVFELPHPPSCSQFVVCWRFGADGFGWCSACKTSTTQNQPHQISNTQRTENKTADVAIHQHSHRLLKMDVLISETCWAHNKWNKIASDIKLVFHSSTIAMMHGLINIRFTNVSMPEMNHGSSVLKILWLNIDGDGKQSTRHKWRLWYRPSIQEFTTFQNIRAKHGPFTRTLTSM